MIVTPVPSRSDLDRWARIIVQAVMGSRAGVHLEPERLHQVIEDRLPDLLDGPRLRFDPVLEALLRIEGVSERDLYVGLVNLANQLGQLGLELEPPALNLDHETRVQLLREAREASAHTDGAPALRLRIQRLREHTKIGRLLVEEGLIGEVQLAEALAAQKARGGRLGTNLVEGGHLSEHDLAHFLSVQLGVPSQTLVDASPDARGLLPAELAERFRVIPTRHNAIEIHLAMADPLDLEAVDAVSEVSGRRVFPIVVPDMQIGLALERAYGVPRTPRIHDDLTTVASQAAPLLPTDTWSDTLDLPALGARMALVDSDVRVFQLVQRFLGSLAPVSAIFQPGEEGWRGLSAQGGPPLNLRDRVIARAEEPLISVAEASSRLRRGPAGEGQLAQLMGLDASTSILILPLGYDRPRAWAVVPETDSLAELAPRVVRMASAALGIVTLRREVLAACTG